jgi:hypothetical protein
MRRMAAATPAAASARLATLRGSDPSAVNPPASTSRAATTARATVNRFSFRSDGAREPGCCGTASNTAISSGTKSLAPWPKYAQQAASTPSKFPPYGANVRYAAKISRLPSRASNCTARSASTTLLTTVRRRGSNTRTSCIVNVEPPDTVRPLLALSHTARNSAAGSTPGCRQNRLSSNRTNAFR